MSGPSGQHVVFTLAGQEYGMPIREVREILRMVAVTRIPELPDTILGVINVRGIIVPVIDIARKLHLPHAEPDDRTKVLIVERPDGPLAFLADRVTDVLDLTPEQAAPPEAATAAPGHGAVVGVAKGPGGLIVLLTPAHLLTEEEAAAVGGLTAG